MSIGTGWLFIHCGALDEVTCHGAKFWVTSWFLCGICIVLLWKVLKSGASCAIKLTNCIDLTIVMSLFFIASYETSTGGVMTLLSKLLFLLNPLRKRLIVSWDTIL